MLAMLSLTLIASCWIRSAFAYEAPEFEYDVIIMGAGMTGISAGHVLNANGYKILIIEAQDYVGGRTKVATLGNYSFNVGGSWIEGVCPTFDTDPSACAYNGHTPTKANPMWELAQKYNISSTDAGYFDYSVLEFVEKGEDIHFADAAEVHSVMSRWNDTVDCMAKLMRHMEENDYEFQDISMFAAMYKCGWQQPLSALEKMIVYTQVTFEYAEDTKYISFLGSEQTIFRDYGKYSNFITDPRGYAGVTLGLASEYLNLQNISGEPQLIINSPITKVAYDRRNRVTVTVNATETGEVLEFNAKYGLVTFSLGVMQSDIVEFDPPLGDEKRDAFLAYNMVHYLPVLVQWPHNFWSKLGVNSHVIDFVDERDNFWIWAYNFDHPDFYPGSHVWRFDIITSDALRVQGQSEEDTIRELIDQKLSFYFGEDVLPEPVAILHHDWSRNRYVQGMYSDWNLGMNGYKTAKMEEPYIDEGLFFAGEAFSTYSGDVNGAYNSGRNVADAIMAADRL